MFSVIIPAYNSEKTIEKTLDSLQNQTKPELIQEVIIINDGSTDGTKDKVEQYKSRQDCILNIILYNQQNAGVAAARNAGIRMATADYLAFLDSDDCWAPEKLEWQKKFKRKSTDRPALWRAGRRTFKNFSAKRLFVTSVIAERILHKERYIYLNRCDTQARVKDAGYFDESMQYCEDMNYYQRFFEWNQVYYLPKKLVDYGIGRKYYGQSGLSSHLKEMHCGRKRNFQILRRKKKDFFYILYCDDCIW